MVEASAVGTMRVLRKRRPAMVADLLGSVAFASVAVLGGRVRLRKAGMTFMMREAMRRRIPGKRNH